MAERALVTGATGKVGRELVRLLLEAGSVVRAGTRDPARASELFGAAVEVVELDYDATETYDAAVQWVDRIYLTPAPFDPHAYETLLPFLDWAVASGVRRVVLQSAMDIEAMPELPLRKLERHIAELGIAYTLLRPNLLMQNLSSGFILDGIRREGGFELCAGEGRVSFVDAPDVAAAAAVVLSGGNHDGVAYTLTGGRALDFHEAADILSGATGRTIRYRPVGEARMRALLHEEHWPDHQVPVAVALFASVAAGRREPAHGDLSELLGREPRSFETFAHDHAEVWRVS